MTYRSDHDALLARNDALTREVAELREKTAALEAAQARASAETAATAAKRRGLERLAADEPKRPAPVSPQATATTTAPLNAGRLEFAFALRWESVVFAIVALGGGIAVLGLSRLAVGNAAVVGLLAWLPFSFWLFMRYRAYRVRRGRRWLERLPIHVDHVSYMTFMSEDSSGAMHLAITFGELPDERDRSLIVRAIEGGRLGATAVWRGDDVLVSSPSKEVMRAGRGGSYVNNAPLHRWFRRSAVRRLLEIHAMHPIARVSVERGGDDGSPARRSDRHMP